MGGFDPLIPADDRPIRSSGAGTSGQRSCGAVTLLRRGTDRSINAVCRRYRIRRAIAGSLRTAGALCVAGLSLSNAPAGEHAGPSRLAGEVRIALADVRSEAASLAAPSRPGASLVGCRSHLDGSFSALIDAASARVGAGQFTHIVTDITRVEGATAKVAMIYQSRDGRGRTVVREARASIDLASCNAADLSVPSA